MKIGQPVCGGTEETMLEKDDWTRCCLREGRRKNVEVEGRRGVRKGGEGGGKRREGGKEGRRILHLTC